MRALDRSSKEKSSIVSYFPPLLLLFLVAIGCSNLPAHVEGMPQHHTAEGYRNYPVTDPEPYKGMLFNVRRFWDYFSLPPLPQDHYLDEQRALIQYYELEHENTLTWLGHSTFLIKINGKTILTDPYLTDIASPFIIGPRRYVPPGITLLNLPAIDMIIVSHNHADHLDAETIEKLSRKETILVFVPLGLKDFFTKRGFTHVTELDWNQEATAGEFHVEALPAIHNSGRKLFHRDWNKTLWCSWAISSPSERVYFAGSLQADREQVPFLRCRRLTDWKLYAERALIHVPCQSRRGRQHR